MSNPAVKLPTQKTFFDSAVRIGLLSAVPFALLWSWQMSFLLGWPFRNVLPFGIACGAAFGFFFGIGAGIKFKDIVVRLDLADPLNFPAQLAAAMSGIGFKLAAQNDENFIYEPTLRCGLFTGRIWGEWNQDEAAIVGPSWYVKKLITRLARDQKRSLQQWR